jgi:hypothetical protein
MADIQTLKQKYGSVFQVESTHPDTGEKHTVFLRRPSLKEFDLYTKLQNGNQPVSGLQTVAKQLVIDGDPAVIVNELLFITVLPVIDQMFAVKAASVKKL